MRPAPTRLRGRPGRRNRRPRCCFSRRPPDRPPTRPTSPRRRRPPDTPVRRRRVTPWRRRQAGSRHPPRLR
ncbi:hypothetical protein E1193_30570 [Micromonospora sp. KC606]|nr:hypothetical protein E1193_30570 [Micromonospora sp. KC606]